MSTGTRVSLDEGQRIAEALLDRLRPVCQQMQIAGSIRRQEPTVGDVEVLVTPCLQPVLDLFGEASGETVSALDAHVAALVEQGVLALRLDVNGRPRCGSRYKALTYQGLNVDLFACIEPAQWGVLLAIRTGPAAWSKRLVTPRRQGGLLPDWLQVQDGALHRRDDGTIIPTPDEESLFAALGRPWVPPEERR